MTSTTFLRSTGIAMLAATTVLLAAAGGANARGGGSGGGSHPAHSGSFQNPIRNTIHPIIVNKGGLKTIERNGNRNGTTVRKTRREKLEELERKGAPKPVLVQSSLAQPAKPSPAATASTTAVAPPTNTIHPIINPNPQPGVTTISNGVIKSLVPNGAGLTVSSNAPGMITVSNGTSSVTVPGGSLVLSGTASVAAGAGVQIVRQPNGNVTVAANLPPAAPPAPAPSGPKSGLTGTGPIDEIKGIAGQAGVMGQELAKVPSGIKTGVVAAGHEIANGLEALGKDFFSLGGPKPQPKTSSTTQQ